MKVITLFLSLIVALATVTGTANAQSADEVMVCEGSNFSIKNNRDYAILAVDVRYKNQALGKWVEFPNTRNRVVEPGGSVEWQRSVKGVGYGELTAARLRYKKRVGDRWVPVRKEARSTKAPCEGHDTYFIFWLN